MAPERELAVAVLWLRNHLDVSDQDVRMRAIKTADALLEKHGEPSGIEYGEFIRLILTTLP